MRLIPRNTKVQTSFYKGITIADVILGLVGLGLAALAVASNLPYRLFIALGIACLFIPLFIPVGYQCRQSGTAEQADDRGLRTKGDYAHDRSHNACSERLSDLR